MSVNWIQRALGARPGPRFGARLDVRAKEPSAREARRRERVIRERLARIAFHGGRSPAKSAGAIVSAFLTGGFLIAMGSAAQGLYTAPPPMARARGASAWISAALGGESGDSYQLWDWVGGFVENFSIGAGAVAVCVGAALLIARWRWMDLEPAGPEEIEPLREELAWLRARSEREQLERVASAARGVARPKRL